MPEGLAASPIFGLGRNAESDETNYGPRTEAGAAAVLRGGEAALAGMVPTPGCQMHSLTFMRRRLPINPGFQSDQQLAQSLESEVAGPGPHSHL